MKILFLSNQYELRKLYTQLQIYKTKTMRQDNPHISKRKGGKKQTIRKFSFQNLHSKYKGSYKTSSGSTATSTLADQTENSTATVGGELSARSLDESSNSIEGVSVYMDENSYVPPDAHCSPQYKPQISNKSSMNTKKKKVDGLN